MKLIIQIPCLNEEATLPATLADLPREVAGFDDGRVADHRRRLDRPHDRGRARARRRPRRAPHEQQGPGLRLPGRASTRALKLGADVIVNTDADNQYYGGDIAKLVEPILRGDADMVVGDREVDDDRALLAAQEGAAAPGLVGRAARLLDRRCPTPPRASAPTTARPRCQMQVVSKFTYTLETIIQAGKMLIAVDHVPVQDEREAARVAAVPVDVEPTSAATASRSSASTRCTSRCACS